MKISKLIAILNNRLEKYGDRDINVTWEGMKADIKTTSVSLGEDAMLFIDDDGNYYKKAA